MKTTNSDTKQITLLTSLLVIIHAIIILLAFSSPFWLDWRLVVVGVVANSIQIIAIGGCVLSHAQFDDKAQTFHEWYLKKLGVNVNRQILNIFLRWVIPLMIVLLALGWQVILDQSVLTSF